MILSHGDEYSSSERAIFIHQTTRLTFHMIVHTGTTASERQTSLTHSLNNVSHRGQWGHIYRRLVEVTGSVPGRQTGYSEPSKVTGCLCLHHKHVWGSGGTAPHVLKLGTRLGGSFTPAHPLPPRDGNLKSTDSCLLSEMSDVHTYTECLRRNVPDFGRVFLMLNYTDITQNTYVQS